MYHVTTYISFYFYKFASDISFYILIFCNLSLLLLFLPNQILIEKAEWMIHKYYAAVLNSKP